MNLQSFSLKVKIILGNCFPLILVVILCALASFSVNTLLRSNKWVNHSHTVVQEAMDIEAFSTEFASKFKEELAKKPTSAK